MKCTPRGLIYFNPSPTESSERIIFENLGFSPDFNCNWIYIYSKCDTLVTVLFKTVHKRPLITFYVNLLLLGNHMFQNFPFTRQKFELEMRIGSLCCLPSKLYIFNWYQLAMWSALWAAVSVFNTTLTLFQFLVV